ncbi:MAG: TetR/AcrR family transcriptional regulator [Phenylobacterium sp.]|uniref:TetR/AcrR family transcriptional regulator n=1 Tax=Phenylobacterium sp. TaxID=1871053 RepID=UPI0027353CEB|nr:TetR/AcrR family transcriptional regulator [Phenylobacterium sp.]MDP3750039.1 TetR/AcrR family transcriptional regulator [Phenylobacterium sp.]
MKALTLREKQRRETRERILFAACELFGRDGFSAVRTQDVALEAGVSHGAVFAHFLTREALIAAAVEDTVVRSVNLVRHELRLTNSATDVLHAHLAVLAEHEGLHANIVAEQRTLPAGVQARLIEVNSGVASHLLASLERDVGAASLKVERHFVFNTWLALVHYYLLNRHLFAPGRSVLTERADELVRNYLALIGDSK